MVHETALDLLDDAKAPPYCVRIVYGYKPAFPLSCEITFLDDPKGMIDWLWPNGRENAFVVSWGKATPDGKRPDYPNAGEWVWIEHDGDEASGIIQMVVLGDGEVTLDVDFSGPGIARE